MPSADADTTSASSLDMPAVPPAKWWGESVTIWGALLTAASTVLPVLGPVFGLNLSPDLIQQLGGQMIGIIQAIAGLAGTLMTIYGRARATLPLVRRSMTIQL